MRPSDVDVHVGEDEDLERGAAREEGQQGREGDGRALGQEEVRERAEWRAGHPAHVSQEQAAQAGRPPVVLPFVVFVAVVGRTFGRGGRG